jgi:hypothetical protein
MTDLETNTKQPLWKDPIIDAYAIFVDGKYHGAVSMPENRGYRFSYWHTLPDAYIRYLPAEWKSFSVFDIPAQRWHCGRVKP